MLIILIESILIGLRICLPYLYKLYKKFFGVNGEVIEKGPIYLNKEHILGIIKNNKKTNENNKNNQNIMIRGQEINPINYNYNYAISLWIWINPSVNTEKNKSISIFDYGNILKINYIKNNIEILALTSQEGHLKEYLVKIYKTDKFYYQKWNHILLNYNGGTLDVFINNKLVSSSMNITPIMSNNNIIAGSNNGIQGGIKNIVYYDKILSRNEINTIYDSE